MKYIIGISSFNRDSTVSLLTENGTLLGAVSEEKFSRVKQQGGFPHMALRYLLSNHNVKNEQIDSICYSFMSAEDEEKVIREKQKQDNKNYFSLINKWHRDDYDNWCNRAISGHKEYNKLLYDSCKQYDLEKKIRFYHHHFCHATTAYYYSGFDNCLVITIDWYGSGLSGQIYKADSGSLTPILDIPMPHSLGMFYAQVTRALGFKISRHEGKILGLAAYGKESMLSYWLEKQFIFDGKTIRFKNSFANNTLAKYQFLLFGRENMAFAYQKVLENVSTKLVDHYLKQEQMSHLALAGGVAANVKNNQRLYELEGVKGIFIQPDMGDGGAGLGAALARVKELQKLPVKKMGSVYLGPSFSDQEIEAALKKNEITYEKHDDIEKIISDLLIKGEIIARFNGQLEYGPRALGNRSILSQATDSAINESLNKQLQRTEFMPFAPATRIEDAEICYKNCNNAKYACRFMTMTLDCTEEMKKMSPAAVHIDGTARPQLVRKEDNPSFHKILTYYKNKTGISSIINTSFNIHEEPIVCSPEDAIRGLIDARLKYLAIGPFLAQNKCN